MTAMFHPEWVYTNGAPFSLSADREFYRPFRDFLRRDCNIIDGRPSRSASKNSEVDQNSDILKTVSENSDRQQCSTSVNRLVLKAFFLTNIFHEPRVLSALHFARGFPPSIIGVPFTYAF